MAMAPETGELAPDVRAIEWVDVKDRRPDRREPVVYKRPSRSKPGKWGVGIAYWTVSQKWYPEPQSTIAPEGFTHWFPLPESEKEAEDMSNAPASDVQAALLDRIIEIERILDGIEALLADSRGAKRVDADGEILPIAMEPPS